MTDFEYTRGERPDGKRAGDRPRLLVPDGKREKDPVRRIREKPARPDRRDPRML